MSKLIETLVVYRRPAFRRLWFGALAANTGGLVQAVGAAWMMTLLTPSQAMVALVPAAATLPVMLGGYMAGVLADNFDRRRVMLIAQFFMLAMSIALLVLTHGGVVTPWLLLSLTFLIGCGTALHGPSWQASLGDLVPREELPSAVSINAMGMNMTRSLGPAAGGAIVAVAGVAAAFLVNVIAYFAIIQALLRWRPERIRTGTGREGLFPAFNAGLRYFVMSPFQLKSTARAFIFGFGAVCLLSLMPVIARQRLDGDAFLFGMLLASFGLGAVLAALGGGYIRAAFGNEAIMRMGFLTFAGCVNVIGFSSWPLLTAFSALLAGICWLSVMSLTNGSIQMITPRWVVGRIVALYMTGIACGTTLGSWTWGVVAERYGVELALHGAGAVLVLGAVWGLLAPMPAFSLEDMQPAAQLDPLATHIPIGPRSGPITISIEYEIAPEHVAEFLTLMERRRRLRLRAGALGWSLHRDIEMSDLWLEIYRFRDWAEYMRNRERRVSADVENLSKLLALHRGKRPQRVHRICGIRHLHA